MGDMGIWGYDDMIYDDTKIVEDLITTTTTKNQEGDGSWS